MRQRLTATGACRRQQGCRCHRHENHTLPHIPTVRPRARLAYPAAHAGWAFSGGADVAWLTDELGQPGRIARVLATRAQWDLLVLAATMAINGAGMTGWLFPRRLVGLGLPGGPVLGYTVVTILSSAAGVIALRSAEAWIDRAGAARRIYALACFTGMAGLVVLARAPDALVGGIGALPASGIGFNVTRAVSVIWVNRRTRARSGRRFTPSFLRPRPSARSSAVSRSRPSPRPRASR
jgi:hypothetical protein